jgi:hypothetical protein
MGEVGKLRRLGEVGKGLAQAFAGNTVVITI